MYKPLTTPTDIFVTFPLGGQALIDRDEDGEVCITFQEVPPGPWSVKTLRYLCSIAELTYGETFDPEPETDWDALRDGYMDEEL